LLSKFWMSSFLLRSSRCNFPSSFKSAAIHLLSSNDPIPYSRRCPIWFLALDCDPSGSYPLITSLSNDAQKTARPYVCLYLSVFWGSSSRLTSLNVPLTSCLCHFTLRSTLKSMLVNVFKRLFFPKSFRFRVSIHFTFRSRSSVTSLNSFFLPFAKNGNN
jgi:hypothetical protein